MNGEIRFIPAGNGWIIEHYSQDNGPAMRKPYVARSWAEALRVATRLKGKPKTGKAAS